MLKHINNNYYENVQYSGRLVDREYQCVKSVSIVSFVSCVSVVSFVGLYQIFASGPNCGPNSYSVFGQIVAVGSNTNSCH